MGSTARPLPQYKLTQEWLGQRCWSVRLSSFQALDVSLLYHCTIMEDCFSGEFCLIDCAAENAMIKQLTGTDQSVGRC